MFLYFLIGFILFAFALFTVIRNSNQKAKINFFEFICCLAPLFLLVCFRSVGFDFDAYERAFDESYFSSVKAVFNDFQFEPGYVFLNLILPSFSSLIFVIGFLSLFIKLRAIYELSPYPILSILLLYLAYLLNFEMGQIRQALAMSITMYSVLFYENKKKFFMHVLLAVLFHYSALLFLLVLIVPKRILNVKFYVFLLLLSIVLFFTIEPLVIKLFGFFPGFSYDKLLIYYESEQGEITISYSLIALKFIILFLFLVNKNKIIALEKPIYEFIFNIYFLSVFIYFTFAFFRSIAGRGGVYFAIFDVLIIPIILKAIETPLYRVLVLILFTLIYSVIFVNFLSDWGEEFIPYKSWLF